jgi:hypothetical protein
MPPRLSLFLLQRRFSFLTNDKIRHRISFFHCSTQWCMINNDLFSFSSLSTPMGNNADESSSRNRKKAHQLLWRAPDIDVGNETIRSSSNSNSNSNNNNNDNNNIQTIWTRSIMDEDDTTTITLSELMAKISEQERRTKVRQLGVIREDPAEDMYALIHNYTVPALASALRDREDTLQQCAGRFFDTKLKINSVSSLFFLSYF